jgi:hypothetical protein
METQPNSSKRTFFEPPFSFRTNATVPAVASSLPSGYFDELREKIHLLRASERDAFLRICSLIEECSLDYDGHARTTRDFFRSFQNKLHLAICGKTAAQLILERANASLPNMGLQSWGDGPDGRIYKRDVVIAKNYLLEKELTRLNRIVGMFLDFAELQAERGVVMHLLDWSDKLDAFLDLLDLESPLEEYEDLRDEAFLLASEEYEKFVLVHDHSFLRISRKLSA